jgi:hypothetical protein
MSPFYVEKTALSGIIMSLFHGLGSQAEVKAEQELAGGCGFGLVTIIDWCLIAGLAWLGNPV